ncbi:hypothetical protein BDN70DRAFT_993502 [Pholiota conissans]|uniref:F-box domain-containing protein n=1 Tax=Pholiota conissans TaxID=109636 RepID=A0A9P5Z3D7_9AGAR|nr:hypothetical protein BDN70DRAFT_993502 [Pholiota conissans]
MSLLLSSMNLQKLPLELVEEIFRLSALQPHDGVRFYNKRSLSRLRLISRQFEFAVDPFLFSDVTFDFETRGNSLIMDCLGTLADSDNSWHPACQYATTLCIRSLPSVERSPFNDIEYYSWVSEQIPLAIKSLKNVRVLHWDICGFDHLSAVVDGLSELPHLQDIHIRFYLPYIYQIPGMVPLHRFKTMQSLDAGGLSVLSATDFASQLRTVLGHGQFLKKLGLNLPHSFGYSAERHLLRDIVKDMSPGTHLSLEYLRLGGFSLELDSITLPHLRNLSSLDVSREPEHRWNPKDEQFWNNMASARIRIRDLVIDGITRPILAYLQTYEGLERLTSLGCEETDLSLSERSTVAPEEARSLSDELYNIVLPLHKEYFLMFKTQNHYLGRAPTYLTYQDMISLSVCKKLLTLYLIIEGSSILDKSDNDVKHLIEIALQLPEIESISLIVTVLDPYSSTDNTATQLTSVLTSIGVPNEVTNRSPGDFCTVQIDYHEFVAYIAEGYVKIRSA